MQNFDAKTVRSFGKEWSTYDQGRLAAESGTAKRFKEYFQIFPWTSLPLGAVGADIGCGSGRWALYVAPRVGMLHCIDASADALAVAPRDLAGQANCRFHHVSVDAVPLPSGSLDFCYSLGVLHHIPDSSAGIAACVALLRSGVPFLRCLHYAMEQRAMAAPRRVTRNSHVRRPTEAGVGRSHRRGGVLAARTRKCVGRAVRRRPGRAAAPLVSKHVLPHFARRCVGPLAMHLDSRFSRLQRSGLMRQPDLDEIRSFERSSFRYAVSRQQISQEGYEQ